MAGAGKRAFQWLRDLLAWILPLRKFNPNVAALEFQGAIVRSPRNALALDLGVKGASQVWFPKSVPDVATAVAHARNLRTIIKSGMQAAATDAVDVAGGVIINLAVLDNVTVTNDVVKTEAAATVGTIAEQLAEHGLALPLIDNRRKSIASSLLDTRPSCLIRTLGVLSDYVSVLNAVTATGEPTTLSGASAVASLRGGNSVITEVVFKAAPAQDLWMIRKSFLYPGKETSGAILDALLLSSQIPPQCDVVVDAVSARHDIPLIRITAAGASASARQTAVNLVEQALAKLPGEFAREVVTEEQSGSSVIRSIVDAGYGIPIDSQVEARRIHSIFERRADANEVLNRVIADVDRGLSFRSDRTGKLHHDLRLFIRLQRNREDRLELSGFIYTRRPRRARRLGALEATAPGLLLPESLLPSAVEFALEGTPRIPDFRGAVYIPSDLLFDLHAAQYATSSFPRTDMTPFMLAYPVDEADIQAAIKFARANQKHIVARSGGHQYCGMSSGGEGTIVLSMDTFNHFNDISDNVVEVGPAVPLTELAANFNERGITIPHGECPLVCVGGHLQTGGYGHLARGFGLELDYVKEFTIVLADGSVRTVSRPNGQPATDDGELFWGVLGGNAGSFGIITNYRVECIKDVDHPNSYGFSAIRRYEKERYRTLMKEVQSWTQRVVAGNLRPDIDFMMTVESSIEPFLPPVHLVELVYSNVGGTGEHLDADQVFGPIIDATNAGPEIWNLLTTQGPKSLSDLSDSFVRRFPETTVDGREFKYPYKKRVNCTSVALTDEFVDLLVDMVDKVVTTTPGVHLVFQMLIGGGSFQNSSRRSATSIPRRDSVFTFVFDLFYDTEDIENEPLAEQLQTEMQGIIDTHFSRGQEQRLFWGTFGNIDITNTAVRNLYYDDANRYARLQQLKKKIDPEDVFHSQLTVKLP